MGSWLSCVYPEREFYENETTLESRCSPGAEKEGDAMRNVTVITQDPIVGKLLQYMAAELPETAEKLVLLDAAQMERVPEFPGKKVILFSASADPGYLKPARGSGAAGFWYLEPSVESLFRVLTGEPAFPEKAPEVQLGDVKSSALTPRELEVLRELSKGKKDAHIGEALGMSVPTVKHHIQQLLLKTGFENRTQLATAAVRSRLVSKNVTKCNIYTFV